MSEFYIVLPSNTETDIFPNNKTSDFEIPLPRALEFNDGTWEVCLVELHYPHSWHNVRSPFLQVEFAAKQIAYRGKVEHGYYMRTEELIHAINSLKPHNFEGKIFISRTNKRVKAVLHPGEYIHFKKELAALLGFETHELENPFTADKKLLIKAPNVSDVHATMHNIFVYTNIVKETLVGKGYCPLLRIVPTDKGEHGNNVHMTFINPFYHELALDRISSIRITLCDDQGQPVRFQFGKVICKLHFRRKRLQLV